MTGVSVRAVQQELKLVPPDVLGRGLACCDRLLGGMLIDWNVGVLGVQQMSC